MPEMETGVQINDFLDRKLAAIERWQPAVPANHQLLNAIRQVKAELKSCIADIIRIPVKFKQREIRQELRTHLTQAMQDEMEAGASLDEAWCRTLEIFGDVNQHLSDLERVHRIQLYKWFGRLAMFGVLLLLMNAFSLHWRAFFYTPLLLVIFVASMAALICPGKIAFTSWRFILPRIIMMSQILIAWLTATTSRSELVLLCAVLLILMFPNNRLNALNFSERFRNYSLIAAMVFIVCGLTGILTYHSEPEKLGSGIYLSIISLIFGIVFGRPSWCWTMAYAAALGLVIYLTFNSLRIHNGIDVGHLMVPEFLPAMGSIALALIMGWVLLGKMPARHWLPAAGLLATIFLLIRVMSALTIPQVNYIFSVSFVPFVSFCLLALILELRSTIRFHA